MASVTLQGVSKVFPGGVQAVDRVNLEVNDREFLVLVGPSGCGKTTMLRLIAGLESLSEGTVRIGQRVVNRVAPKDRNLAMVFQNFALYPHLSVYKNMAFGLQLRYGGNWFSRIWWRLTDPLKAAELAAKRRGINRQVRQAAQMLGIEHLLRRMPRQLSGGERQRVALGRAIVRKPAAFLFDEPLSNVDAQLRVHLRRELKRLHQQLQATMIYVTHDQVEALTLGQRIGVMDRGRVHQVGTPMEVYDRPRNRRVAALIGTPPMNFVAGRLEEIERRVRFTAGGWRIPIGQIGCQKLKSSGDRNVLLGIRPEDVHTAPADAGPPAAGHNRARVVDVQLLGDASVIQVQPIGPLGEAQNGGRRNEQNSLWIKTQGRTTLAPGEAVDVWLDSSRAHWFDPASGSNLTLTESD